jgi:hypothetical protein
VQVSTSLRNPPYKLTEEHEGALTDLWIERPSIPSLIGAVKSELFLLMVLQISCFLVLLLMFDGPLVSAVMKQPQPSPAQPNPTQPNSIQTHIDTTDPKPTTPHHTTPHHTTPHHTTPHHTMPHHSTSDRTCRNRPTHATPTQQVQPDKQAS